MSEVLTPPQVHHDLFSSGELPAGRFPQPVIHITGAAALCASLLTFGAIWLQAKHYMKPFLQRSVVRILALVPIFAFASWTSLVSPLASEFIVPLRDIYEAFTIYTFFQLLISYLRGERALILRMSGRPPVPHLWPFGSILTPVDISDSQTFLAIKRGILQYVWMKPLLAVATIIMKATGSYKEGYLGLTSGYLWSGLIYNVSVTICLYALALFWVCMADELKPFRPVPKFLCVKGIIFASYWQGMFLSVLVAIGAFPESFYGYRPDTLASAIQDALLCFEMPFFSLLHWYAFSWHDYATDPQGRPYRNVGRMPIRYALRDAGGIADLIADTKITWRGEGYGYRSFAAHEAGLAHEASRSRVRRQLEGLRYTNEGRTYWVDDRSNGAHSPLLRSNSIDVERGVFGSYGTVDDDIQFESPESDPTMEDLYAQAKKLEFGDYMYPVLDVELPHQQSRTVRKPVRDPVPTRIMPRTVRRGPVRPKLPKPRSPSQISARPSKAQLPPSRLAESSSAEPGPSSSHSVPGTSERSSEEPSVAGSSSRLSPPKLVIEEAVADGLNWEAPVTATQPTANEWTQDLETETGRGVERGVGAQDLDSNPWS